MEKTDGTESPSAEIAIEAQKLAELKTCLQAINILQSTFGALASPQEQKDAEGRRCVLAVTGLKHHPQANVFFEVRGARIHMVDPFESYNTLIAAPIDSVLRVLKAVLDGREDAFSREWARGQARIQGKRSLHDGQVFSDAFRRVARMIQRYKVLQPR